MNHGKLLLDATCVPADIAYPTDLTLLNEACEKLEAMIDVLHAARQPGRRKPRTYRRKVRRAYLAVAKQRRVSPRTLRKAMGKPLRFVARDLRTLAALRDEVGLEALSRRQYRDLLVIKELYRQQEWMYRKQTRRIDDRIVSISQPHVRPIVRGKVEAYRERYGGYPEAVLADKAYRNRENRRYCKHGGIRLSGPPLGRPSQVDRVGRARLEQQDAAERNAIEWKFGEGKRMYGLGLIRARLRTTSETVITLQLLVMNLERRLRILLCTFFGWLFRSGPLAVFADP